jgi:hypothetical protein
MCPRRLQKQRSTDDEVNELSLDLVNYRYLSLSPINLNSTVAVGLWIFSGSHVQNDVQTARD